MMKYLLLLLMGICCSQDYATAQYNLPLQQVDWSQTTLFQDDTAELKKPDSALLTSILASTLLPILSYAISSNSSLNVNTIALISLTPGPGFGYFHSKNYGAFIEGLFKRGLGVGLAALGSHITNYASSSDNDYGSLLTSITAQVIGGIIFFVGISVYTISTIKDFVGVRKSVIKRNESLRKVKVSPVLNPTTNTYGMGLRLNF